MVKAVHKYENEFTGTLHDTPADAIAAERESEDTTNGSKKIVSPPVAKKITIKRCRECHLKEYRGGSDEPSTMFCINKMTYGMQIDDENTIPDWCELEDDLDVIL